MRQFIIASTMALFTVGSLACGNVDNTSNQTFLDMEKLDTATFGAGCFWCVEAVFQTINGVESVESGYSGGHIKNPAYKEVCNGSTGHAEVCRITYDPGLVTYEKLLEAFWLSHDPTTINRQGADVGTQYRSVVFFHNENQQRLAESYKNRLNAERAFPSSVVTEISPLINYYSAEDQHQDYYQDNTEQPYCSMVIGPKLDKFKKVFRD